MRKGREKEVKRRRGGRRTESGVERGEKIKVC